MYFSTSMSGNPKAAKIVAVAAEAFGLTLTTPDYAHVPFESAVAAIANGKGMAPEQVVSELIRLEPTHRRKSLDVGSAEIVKGFGSEAQTMAFFRQASNVRSVLRFDGVGGISDDVHTVRNNLTSLAAAAYLQRQQSEAGTLLPIEREYVDLLKSVRLSMEESVTRGTLPPDAALEIVSSIENAVQRVPLPGMSEYVGPLHSIIGDELYAEALERVQRRYAVAPSNDGPELS